jgi:hypothetical protein
MKQHIIKFVSLSVLFMGILYSCKKGQISGDSANLIEGSYLTLTKNINGNLDFSNPAATVSIQVGSKGLPIQSVNIYAATGAALDKSTWKLIKNVAYTEGMNLVVTTAELAKALAPNPIAPGSQYVLQNEVVLADGRKFSAFNTPSNFSSLPAYNFALTWKATAVCAFSQAGSVGKYKVVYDGDWVDYNTGDTLSVFAGPTANSIQFLAYPSTVIGGGTNRQPWIVNVDAATGAATMATQYIGDYPGAPNAKAAATGFVFSCTGLITLKVDVTYAGSLYGGLSFILQKQ